MMFCVLSFEEYEWLFWNTLTLHFFFLWPCYAVVHTELTKHAHTGRLTQKRKAFNVNVILSSPVRQSVLSRWCWHDTKRAGALRSTIFFSYDNLINQMLSFLFSKLNLASVISFSTIPIASRPQAHYCYQNIFTNKSTKWECLICCFRCSKFEVW